MNLVRAELFKLRSTSAWWVFAASSVLSTAVMLVVNCVNARSLLLPFSQYVALHTHGGDTPPPDFVSRLKSDWVIGHNPVTQAASIYTSGQLIGLLLVCLLGIVIVTGEYQQQTATTTFLTTPRRLDVLKAKLISTVAVAVLAWAVTTTLTILSGAIFLHTQGYGIQLSSWSVVRAILLNLVAYTLWAAVGVGFGALIRSQLVASIGATVLYLVGVGAAGTVFELLNTYVLTKDWVLAAQVIVPPVASSVMISPTPTFDQSPPAWVGALVLVCWAVVLGALGARQIRRRDIT